MQNPNLVQQLKRIDDLFKKTEQASKGDIEILSHWARYLCVICAGFLENALDEICAEFVRGAASDPVARFASAVLSKIQNPKMQKLVETAYAFKPEWGEKLENFGSQEGRKDAIDSIMANRHLIAHGDSSGITLTRLKGYFYKSVEVLEYLERLCKNQA